MGCLIYIQTQKVLRRYEIDDPLDISQSHGLCGLFALIASGMFDSDNGFIRTGNPDFLLIQIVGSLSLALWAGIMSFIFFYVLKKVDRLRLDGLFEVIGIDCMMHGTQNEVNLDMIRR